MKLDTDKQTPEFIELKPDRGLLDVNFTGYRLSLTNIPVQTIPIKTRKIMFSIIEILMQCCFGRLVKDNVQHGRVDFGFRDDYILQGLTKLVPLMDSMPFNM